MIYIPDDSTNWNNFTPWYLFLIGPSQNRCWLILNNNQFCLIAVEYLSNRKLPCICCCTLQVFLKRFFFMYSFNMACGWRQALVVWLLCNERFKNDSFFFYYSIGCWLSLSNALIWSVHLLRNKLLKYFWFDRFDKNRIQWCLLVQLSLEQLFNSIRHFATGHCKCKRKKRIAIVFVFVCARDSFGCWERPGKTNIHQFGSFGHSNKWSRQNTARWKGELRITVCLFSCLLPNELSLLPCAYSPFFGI